MRRLHLFEITDKKWCPQAIRAGVVDCILFGVKKWKLDVAMASLLHRSLERAGASRVVDLCSGSGGPWLHMLNDFEALRLHITVCLTDKFPNAEAFEYACSLFRDNNLSILDYCPESIDATNVPKALTGFRTIFSGFHHFLPVEAHAILQDAVDCRQGIAIFEITQRTVWAMLNFIAVSLFMPFCIPFIRPFRWSRLVWTYLIPVLPLVVLFDSVVSCLRTYSVSELRNLTKEMNGQYVWETGEVKVPHAPVPITYLLGYPQHM